MGQGVATQLGDPSRERSSLVCVRAGLLRGIVRPSRQSQKKMHSCFACAVGVGSLPFHAGQAEVSCCSLEGGTLQVSRKHPEPVPR